MWTVCDCVSTVYIMFTFEVDKVCYIISGDWFQTRPWWPTPQSVCGVFNFSHGDFSSEGRVRVADGLLCYVGGGGGGRGGFVLLSWPPLQDHHLAKTGNDSTSQLPVQTENRHVSWQSPSPSLTTPPAPPSSSCPINVSHFLSWSHLDRGRQGGVNCSVLDRKYKLRVSRWTSV